MRTLGMLLLVLASGVASLAQAVPVQVSEPFPLTFTSDWKVSPDGRWVVYLATVNGVDQLFSARTDGSATVRLNGTLFDNTAEGGDRGFVENDFEITADSRYVVYLAEQNQNQAELFRTPIQGGANVRLNSDIGSSDVNQFVLTPDGSQVFFSMGAGEPSTELFRVSVRGGVPVSMSRRAGGGSTIVNIGEIKIDQSSTWVVYEAAGFVYSAQVSGDESRLLGAGGDFVEFWISPDGATVVYSFTTGPVRRRDLFSVPIEGGITVQLSPAGAGAARPRDVFFTPDSARVVFRGDYNEPAVIEPFSGPLNATATLIGAPVRRTPRENLNLLRLAPDGSRAVYSSDHDTDAQTETYSTLVTGGGFIKVSPPFSDPGSDVTGVQQAVQIDSGSQFVVVHADDEQAGGQSLFRTPIAGGSSLQLSSGDVATTWDLTTAGDLVYVADADGLFMNSIAGGTPVLLSHALAANELLLSYRLNSAGTQVVYAVENTANNTLELWSAPVSLAVEIDDASGFEVDEEVEVRLRLSAPAESETVTVFYQTRSGTALIDSDFLDTTGSVDFTGSQVEQTISIPVIKDLFAEPEEFFSVAITAVLGAVATDDSASVSLVDGRTGAGEEFLLAAAVLPGSRTVQVGEVATVFATVINGGATSGLGCTIEPRGASPFTFSYQVTDPQTNALAGVPNVGVDIAPSEFQSFVMTFTPFNAFSPTTIELDYRCIDGRKARVQRGINTVTLGASTTPVPDVIALTTSVDVRTAQNQTDLFAVASLNLGSSAEITVSVDTGEVTLPLNTLVCETEPTTGACNGPAEASITRTFGINSTPTFAIFVSPTASIPFDPSNNRVFIRFTDGQGVERGSTSAAISAP